MEKSQPLSKKAKADYRNKLFDRIVNSRLFCYTVLLIDNLETPLFCDQVGEIENAMIDEEDKNFYLLPFLDFENGENDTQKFYFCVLLTSCQ
jgi:hypothetical protein